MKAFYQFLVIVTITVISHSSSWAQDSHTSDTNRPWYYPDHVVIQFAGNIGILSVGPGYSYLRDKVTTEFLYGITPEFESNTSIHILTGKTTYHPVKLDLGKGYLWEPFKVGTGMSYTIGRQFHTKWPERYPEDYYWWTSTMRLTPFVGTTISRKVGDENTAIKRVEFSPELGTHDLAITSFLTNENFKFRKILNLAFGLKLVF